MFNDRDLKLLAILLGREEWLPGKVLADMLYISARTLQGEIAQVNRLLRQNFTTIKIASNHRLGYYLEGNRTQLKAYIAKQKPVPLADPLHNISDILTILLYETDYITINEIADRTFLAPSSVNFNLSKVRQIISDTKHAELCVHPRKGFRLEAPEYIKRILIVNFLPDKITEVGKQYEAVKELYDTLEPMENIVIDVLTSESDIVEGNSFLPFIRHCALAIIRPSYGFIHTSSPSPHPVDPTLQRIVTRMEESFATHLDETELMCLSRRYEEFNRIGSARKSYPEIEELVHRFFRKAEADTGIRFSKDNGYIRHLCEQLYRMRQRIHTGSTPVTSHSALIESQYPAAFHLVHTILRDLLDEEIPPEEEHMLVPYIASLMYGAGGKLRINIVSDAPVAYIYRFRKELYERYSAYIEIIRIFPSYLYLKKFHDSDEDALFLTTEPSLVFEYPELVYVDLFEEAYQSEMISRQIRQKYNQLRIQSIQRFIEQFQTSEIQVNSSDDSWKDLLEKYRSVPLPEAISTSFIDADTLLVITHDLSEHMHVLMTLNSESYFLNNHIARISYFNISRDNDSNSFCDYIGIAVNSRR